jgi:hypothetical protein
MGQIKEKICGTTQEWKQICREVSCKNDSMETALQCDKIKYIECCEVNAKKKKKKERNLPIKGLGLAKHKTCNTKCKCHALDVQ